MGEQYVVDMSNWEPWQCEYRFGVILVMPPLHVASLMNTLRQAYDLKSHVIRSANISSVSDPLRRELSDDAREETRNFCGLLSRFKCITTDQPLQLSIPV